MADRAEMFSLSTFHSLSPPSCRPPQDISLEEFDDEDLSEITDDCGIGLNYDSDPNEKDCLVLGRCEQPLPPCTFQDDFQEFEMIDDNEEEEEEGEAPPSPSGSPIPSPTPEDTQKLRPTTLPLTVTSTQDSLNNNSGCNQALPPQRASWQETLLHSSSSSSSSRAGRLSPLHPCLQDGPCVDLRSGQGPGLAQLPLKTLQLDAEGNSQAEQRDAPGLAAGEDCNRNLVSRGAPRPPSLAPRSPAALEPLEGRQPPRASPCGSSAHSACAGFPRAAACSKEQGQGAGSAEGQARQPPPASRGKGGSAPPSEDELGKPSGDGASKGPPASAPREPRGLPSATGEALRGSPPASSETTSPSSDPGIEADLASSSAKAFPPCGRRGEDLSSPGSDSGAEGELEAAVAGRGNRLARNMISSISETELDLSSDSSSGRSSHLTNSIEEASSPGSEADLEPPGLKPGLLLDAPAAGGPVRRESRTPPTREHFYQEPPAPVDGASAGPLQRESDPGHSLESLRRSFYLPVGRKLLGEGGEEGNSEYDSESESESEADLSEDSDSPWLLSNLVNRMISEGSYPVKCADGGFPAALSLADTISPASDLEPDVPGEALSQPAPGPRQSIELVDMETLRCSLQGAEEEEEEEEKRPEAAQEPRAGDPGPFLFLSNSTNDVIAPIFPGRPRAGCCSNAAPAQSRLSREAKAGLATAGGDLHAKVLGDCDRIDDVRLEGSTAKTNRCFGLPGSPAPAEEARLPCLPSREGSPCPEERPRPAAPAALDHSLAYDSVKYTLVVDENTQLELVSLQRCTSVLSEEDGELLFDAADPEEDAGGLGEGLGAPDEQSSSSEDSSPEADLHFSKKFLNVFVNSTSRSSSTESFGLFSCMVNGEEREQTHRAVFRFIPRHEDELELEVDDPILVELEEDDYWFRGYNMRTGEQGIFPAFYAHEVVSQARESTGLKRNPCWVKRFNVQFLGSVEVPYHQGNGILCAAMQKIATTRKLTVHLRPPATCDLEISLQGIKLILAVNEYGQEEESERCSHFFQMKNVSFCGCHPRNSCYFGFITKHPGLSRFACHVFVSQESMRPVAECVGCAFQEYYQEHLEFACPTEDIYLE